MAEKGVILAVEGEVSIRMSAVGTLEAGGYQGIEPGNAVAVIKALEACSGIRLVFTDVDIPGSMDGLELAHYVRDLWPPSPRVI